MKYLTLFLSITLLLASGCNRYEAENKHLKDEMKLIREENDFLKAQMVGMKKEIEELGIQFKQQREEMEKTLQAEREDMQKKLQAERELMQKKLQEASKKKSSAEKKDNWESVSKNGRASGTDSKTQTGKPSQTKTQTGKTQSKPKPQTNVTE